ncbi:MAG: hypothetical protein AB7P04_05540 [Bacteriovoracia bacterium]
MRKSLRFVFFSWLGPLSLCGFLLAPGHSFASQCSANLAWSAHANSSRASMDAFGLPNVDYSELDAALIGNLAQTPAEAYAHRLYIRLTGGPANPSQPRFRRVLKLVTEQKYFEAAAQVVETENFLNVRTRNFAAPFTSKDGSPLEPFNDMQALMIGLVRDGLDARLLLTGNLRYSAYASFGLPAVSRANNDHYLKFDEKSLSLLTDLERVDKQWEDLNVGIGALTTRAWAKLQYEAGTNRRALRESFNLFLCAPIESWKMRGVPDSFVRRDVDRAPSGNPANYQNTCRNCHALMDSMAGAFAHFDYVDNALAYINSGVAAKYNQNGEVYPPGYVTSDSSWMNLLDYNTAVDFGWRTEKIGESLPEFANMLANSSAFSRCMVKKVYTEVCGGTIAEHAPGLLDPMVKDLEANGYNLKRLFTKTAAAPECIAHPAALSE